MSVEELQEALNNIPPEGAVNLARRAEIQKEIIRKMQEEQKND